LNGYLIFIAIFLFIYGMLLRWTYKQFLNPINRRTASALSITGLVMMVCVMTLGVTMARLNDRTDAFSRIFPVAEIRAIRDLYNMERDMKLSAVERKNFQFHTVNLDNSDSEQVHVLIVGETSRADHWGICGYNRETSPCLAKRHGLIAYKNVISSGYVTEISVPLILTGLDGRNFKDHYRRKGILGLFSEAGFDTYCLTNQVDYLHIDMHLREADHTANLRLGRRELAHILPDMVLLDSLDNVLKRPGKRKFIVIWTRGNHYNYSERYPLEYEYFKPSSKTIPSLATDIKNRNLLVNSYDNSIRYVDAFIDSVIGRVERNTKIGSVTFISDHGENLLDDDRHYSFHAQPIPSKYVGNVPLFIWCSAGLSDIRRKEVDHLLSHSSDTLSASVVLPDSNSTAVTANAI
jgi:glucan phosphoethanolaminetransferase (alkaline phosphatase superfamily)